MSDPVARGDPVAARALEITAILLRETHPGRDVVVSLDSGFTRDLDLDSLARVELIGRLSGALGLHFPDQAFAEADTLRELLRWGSDPTRTALAAPTTTLGAGRTVSLPSHALTLVDALEWRAQREPDRVHVMLLGEQGNETSLRYGELWQRACQAAGGLVAQGLRTGQTVALMLPTGRDYLTSFFGVLLAGGVPVPIYPPARLAQIDEHVRRHATILANAQASLLITVPQARAVAARLRVAAPSISAVLAPDAFEGHAPLVRRAAGDALALLQYTSGSTGDPKGVALTHANLLANLRAMGRVCAVTAEDVFVSWLPLYHDMGLIGAWLGALYHGFPLVLMSPLAFLARPQRWLEAISRYRGTLSAAPNFAYDLCVRKIPDADLPGLDLSCWRYAFNGAEPVSAATLDAFATRFAAAGFRRASLAPVYGLAECSVGLAFPPAGRGPRVDRVRAGRFAAEGVAEPAQAGDDALQIPACGRPLPDHEVRVVDVDGHELPERRVGRLEFRGPSATAGYYRNAAATARLIRDGWLDSGDMAYLADGEIHLTGRVKDMIIRAGRNLYPYDLEQAVGALPGVRRGCVAVFACAPAGGGGERLVVLAETREQAPAARAALQRHIAQCARDVLGEPADDIVLAPPHAVLKTSSGKIRRAATRDRYLSGGLAPRDLPVWLQAVLLQLQAVHAQLRLGCRRVARRLWGYRALVWFALIAAPVCVCVAVLHAPAASRRLVRHGARLWLRLSGIRLDAPRSLDAPPTAQVLVCNHASYLDGLLLSATLPPDYRFVAKAELAHQRIAGHLLHGLGALFVERGDALRGAENVDALVAALQQGARLVIFPEGTFSRAAGLRAFHTGAFLAATRAQVPVVTCALQGSRALLRDGTWVPLPGTLRFVQGASLRPSGHDWAAAMALAQAARREVLALCGEPDLDAG
ncbi:AMP-binding protein [Niveibacterium umoris]|uniref:1-acyl-sn-glycerol-3-phosphate acyltransferase n=1 Tax=Niveibacterium umoris TaxID=1193620 RepID=A0A840BNJ5_9RHOO|nr:AMP-binding protein [Niveibacterium umoris]MBB4013069.1 1-acyl-sn-glycerol-3-phosphate acyltransferase [Niveibacterium umoris]